jgi:hypothetical protein
MKKYWIKYDHSAGPNTFFVTSLEELSAALDRLIEDDHVIKSSVKVETKEY